MNGRIDHFLHHPSFGFLEAQLAAQAQELTVRGEQVERIFSNYVEKKYLVNRRYQRKLIWTLEEKQSFIDSIINGFPVPIILLAEPAARSDGSLEIIDGMQRMDAIVSFISNYFAVNGQFFDLNTVATTKALLDSGLLKQQTPIMDRDICVAIASYLIPLSIYEFVEDSSVDEVFRRINSGGRQLSRQELRVAGATGSFPDCIRLISSRIRGDASPGDILLLNDMQKISITNRDLPYGIDVDGVFWVRHGILSKDHLRQSRDEEMVADLVAYMVSDGPTASRSELLDDYYGNFFPREGVRADRFNAIDQAIRRRNAELVELDYQRTHDALLLTLESAGQTFSNLLFPDGNANNPVPRYFQAVFLAFHDLIVKKGMAVANREALAKKLKDSGRHIPMQEGGRWGGENRAAAVDAVVGMVQGCFEKDNNSDPALVHWISRLHNLLEFSKTEQSAYDFKQGFLNLNEKPGFDEGSFEKILQTCVAIANIGREQKGYVLVGVAENPGTAIRIEQLFKQKTIQYKNFYITGVEHEAVVLGKSLDELFQMITDRVRASPISEPLKSYINNNIKSVSYYDKTIFVFETKGQDGPSLYGDKYFERQGTQLFEVEPKNFSSLFKRFA